MPLGTARGNGADALDVVADSAADLDLQATIAFRHDAGGVRLHGIDAAVRHHLVELGRLALAAAEQRDERNAGGPRGEVGAGHVQRRLHVRVALEHCIHQPVDLRERARIVADEMGRDLGDAGAGAGRKGGRIEIAERRHLAPAGQPVRADRDQDGIEGVRLPPLRHAVGAVYKRLEDAIGPDGFDLHPGSDR